MGDKIYKMIEFVGTSDSSMEEAIQNAVDYAIGSKQHIQWFEVVETRGRVDTGKIQWQVTIKAGISLEV